MSELLKAFKQFITRDALYIIGGSCILLSVLYVSNRLPTASVPTPLYLFGAGIAYAVGYAIQEAFSLCPFVTTVAQVQPPRFIRWLWERFERRPWAPINNLDVAKATWSLLNGPLSNAKDEYQRLVTLKHIGTTMGTNGFVASAILLGHWLSESSRGESLHFDLAAGLSGICLSMILVLLGWINAAQQARYLCDYEANRQGALSAGQAQSRQDRSQTPA